MAMILDPSRSVAGGSKFDLQAGTYAFNFLGFRDKRIKTDRGESTMITLGVDAVPADGGDTIHLDISCGNCTDKVYPADSQGNRVSSYDADGLELEQARYGCQIAAVDHDGKPIEKPMTTSSELHLFMTSLVQAGLSADEISTITNGFTDVTKLSGLVAAGDSVNKTDADGKVKTKTKDGRTFEQKRPVIIQVLTKPKGGKAGAPKPAAAKTAAAAAPPVKTAAAAAAAKAPAPAPAKTAPAPAKAAASPAVADNAATLLSDPHVLGDIGNKFAQGSTSVTLNVLRAALTMANAKSKTLGPKDLADVLGWLMSHQEEAVGLLADGLASAATDEGEAAFQGFADGTWTLGLDGQKIVVTKSESEESE